MGAVHHHGVSTGVTRHHEERWVERIGPPQVIAFLVGVFFVVNGLIGAIRTGISELPGDTTQVLGLRMTTLLALTHIAFGLVAMLGMTSDLLARSTMGFLGTVAIIGGIVALAQPTETMAWNDTNAIVYLITGAVALVSMAFAHRTIRDQRVIETDTVDTEQI
jgi:hypothetical protein